jgi:hypothetical protein
MNNKYIAFVLSSESRAELLAAYNPAYGRVIAHHVTLAFNGVNEGLFKELSDECTSHLGMQCMEAVTEYDDGAGVQCVKVIPASAGSSVRRDGGTYHITLSLGEGRRPVESNNILKEGGVKIKSTHLRLYGSVQLLDK